jgi:hypothetical protein
MGLLLKLLALGDVQYKSDIAYEYIDNLPEWADSSVSP